MLSYNDDNKLNNIDDTDREFYREMAGTENIERILTSKKLPLAQRKRSHLGFLPQDVLVQYTFEQLDHPKTYITIKKDLQAPNIKKAVIHSDLIIEAINRLIKILSDYNIPFTIVKDPEYKGDIAFELIREK